MRELNQQEIADVTGAGAITDAAAALGLGIGKIIDTGLNTGTQASEAAEALGRGIGMVVETSVNVFTGFFNNLFSFVKK